MKKIFMMVYNDISKDARVLRAADALCRDYEVFLYAIGTTEQAGICSIAVENCPSVGGTSAYLRFIRGAVKECLKIKPDIVYGHDIFSAVPLNIIRRRLKHRCKYVYDAHELFLLQPQRKNGLVERFQYRFEAKSIRNADLVVCAEEKRAEVMMQYHALSTMPTVIKNISYLPENTDETVNDSFSDFFDIPACAVVYAGGMLSGRKLGNLVDAVNHAGKNFKLMLIGDGPAYSMLEEKIRMYDNKNLCIRHALPYAKLSAALKNFDIGYLYYATTDSNNLYCAPNKIYEYAGLGLPILANKNPTVESIIGSYNIGLCTDAIDTGLSLMVTHIDEYRCNMKHFVADNTLEKEKRLLLEAISIL